MRKTILILLITFGFTFSIKAQESNANETGKIYFLRSTGFQGSASAFKVFIDEQFVCKLNNKRYSIHEVAPGKHTCSVQFGGKKSKEKAEKFEVVVEPGQSVYLNVVLETGMLINNTYCEEITETTAGRKMENMKEDVKCL